MREKYLISIRRKSERNERRQAYNEGRRELREQRVRRQLRQLGIAVEEPCMSGLAWAASVTREGDEEGFEEALNMGVVTAHV